ncbi:MAG: FAD-dependent thymidylate synthase, partial [Clostridia bacterium]|nr:FAD-dependent thymidylate synthase [Clostridia bacterium]
TFRIEGLSRAALAQLTRHRLASFDVESQRHVKLEDVRMVMPDSIARSEFLHEAEDLLTKSMDLYKRMVAAGIPAEDSRYVTTQAVETNLIMTANARELRHFFKLRCCNRAQWEIRGVADAMLAICKKVVPELFYGAGPSCVSGGCMEACPCGHRRNEHDWDILPEQAVLDA